MSTSLTVHRVVLTPHTADKSRNQLYFIKIMHRMHNEAKARRVGFNGGQRFVDKSGQMVSNKPLTRYLDEGSRLELCDNRLKLHQAESRQILAG